jgi:hypothetical protein
MAIHGCAACRQKQWEIDRLTEGVQCLKQQLRYEERQATEGFFGARTLPLTQLVKANTIPAMEHNIPVVIMQPMPHAGDDAG